MFEFVPQSLLVIHATSECSSYILAPKNHECVMKKLYAKYSLRQTGEHTGQYILFFSVAILAKKKTNHTKKQTETHGKLVV